MKTEAPFRKGDRVKFSGTVIQRKRDFWLNQGRWAEKSAAKGWIDVATAARGTVEGCEHGKYCPWVVEVRMDDGTLHRSIPGNFILA